MNGLAVAALILNTIWLGVLTLLLALAIRQIGILTVRLSMKGETFSVDHDGPKVGSDLPAEVIAIDSETAAMDADFLLLSATCNPCRELAATLDRHYLNGNIIVLLTGRKELADGLVSMLPPDYRIIRDPEASKMAAALHIQSTPFAVSISRGKVNQKAYIHSKSDLLSLVTGQ